MLKHRGRWFRKSWGSHLPLLMAVVDHTDGPILEIGMGIFSTPYLHWRCFQTKRKLVSYENVPEFFRTGCIQWTADFHEVHLVDSWDQMPVEGNWDVALIDQAPEERRVVDIARLAPYTKYIVAHDSDWSTRRQYNYPSIYRLFKYKFQFDAVRPASMVFSNHDDMSWLKRP